MAGVCASVFAVMVLACSAVKAADLIYGVDTAGNLLDFSSASPGNLIDASAIQGLQINEQIRGIDIINGTLYGLGSFSDLYTLNTGALFGHATLVSTFTPELNGINFAFNSGPSLLYVASDNGQNLSLTTAGVATAGPTLSYAAGDVNAGAQGALDSMAYNYANGVFYGFDGKNSSYVSYNPVTGVLHTIATGVNVAARSGLDISPSTGIEYLATVPSGGSASSLYTVNIGTGAETLVGVIGDPNPLQTIAVVPEPGSASLLAFGVLVMLMRLRRSK